MSFNTYIINVDLNLDYLGSVSFQPPIYGSQDNTKKLWETIYPDLELDPLFHEMDPEPCI